MKKNYPHHGITTTHRLKWRPISRGWNRTPKDPKTVAADLKKVLTAYPKTGQNDVDLGGWKIVSEDKTSFQVEYYSAAGKLAQTYNKGEPFTDDLSLTIAADGSSVAYKSSSRKGSRVSE